MKIDYLTVTLKPGSSGWGIEECIHRLFNSLMIDEWLPLFVRKRSDRHYADIYELNKECYLKVPTPERLATQGICLEMTGQGCDSFAVFLNAKGTNIRTALNRFRGACIMGAVTRCSRIDIAIDDKAYGEDKPKLDLEVISATLKQRAFVSRFRRSQPVVQSEELQSVFLVNPKQIDEKLPYNEIESMNLKTGRIGKTIYLGKRTSGSYVRIYDKLAEQEVHGHKIEENLTAWNRFEIEFHRDNAAAVFSAYCDCKTDEQFAQFISSVAFNLIRFVDMDRTRTYNATVCSWWMEFIGAINGDKIEIHKPNRNRYVRTRNYFSKSMAAVLFALLDCDPENLYTILVEGAKSTSNAKQQIFRDYEALKNLPPGEAWDEVEQSSRELTGLEYWRCYSVDPEFEENLRKTYIRVFNKDINKAV